MTGRSGLRSPELTMNPSVDYGRYQTLNITRRGAQGAVLDVQMKARNGKLPTAGHDGHAELTEI